MSARLRRVFVYILRGYGQMFLANHAGVGALYFIALLIAAPVAGLLSLLGALVISLAGRWRSGSSDMLKTGLFSVNGVLLGAFWAQFPEVPILCRVTLTCLGCLLMACGMVPVMAWLKRRESRFVLFSFPYVLAAWLCLYVIGALGLSDARLSRGWSLLGAGQPDRAAQAFERVSVGSGKVEALRLVGLGWASFQQGNYGEAHTAFSQSLAQDPDAADAYSGLGWTLLKVGSYIPAHAAFDSALRLDPWSADARHGAAWVAKMQGLPSADGFWRTLVAAPLLMDAWKQLWPGHPWVAAVEPWISSGYQRLSSRTMFCWLLFGIGLLWHSRISFVMGASALVVCMAGAGYAPAQFAALGDAALVLNIVALWVAVGGHYLRLRFAGILWLLAGTLLLGAAATLVQMPMAAAGLPLLCLPFNAGLLLAICMLGRPAGCRIPLEWAVTNPEKIRLWQLKQGNADECWRRIRQAQRG